jgi:hypothetical protein
MTCKNWFNLVLEFHITALTQILIIYHLLTWTEREESSQEMDVKTETISVRVTNLTFYTKVQSLCITAGSLDLLVIP